MNIHIDPRGPKLVAELERDAVRIITRPHDKERLYQMADDRFLTVRGEGWSSFWIVQPVSIEDAEDFWSV